MKNKFGRINMKMCDETAAATNTPTTRGKAQMKSEKNLSAENKKKRMKITDEKKSEKI